MASLSNSSRVKCLWHLFAFWYRGIAHCTVLSLWNSVVGVTFEIKCGVRQGGILSPLLFAVYMDDLIDDLRKCGYVLH